MGHERRPAGGPLRTADHPSETASRYLCQIRTARSGVSSAHGQTSPQTLYTADVQTLTMDSVELPAPPTLDFSYDLSWGDTEGDFAILPNFLESAFQAFKKLDADLKLVRGNKEHNEKGMKRVSNFAGLDGDEPRLGDDDSLAYRRRGGDLSKIPIPRFKLLGEATTEAARLVPRLKAMSNELPALSHRFVTLQLEEGMDL